MLRAGGTDGPGVARLRQAVWGKLPGHGIERAKLPASGPFDVDDRGMISRSLRRGMPSFMPTPRGILEKMNYEGPAPAPTEKRQQILNYLRVNGAIVDPSGLAARQLGEAIESNSTSSGLAQLLAAMERSGQIHREVRGKRTYLIALGPAPGPRQRRGRPRRRDGCGPQRRRPAGAVGPGPAGSGGSGSRRPRRCRCRLRRAGPGPAASGGTLAHRDLRGRRLEPRARPGPSDGS